MSCGLNNIPAPSTFKKVNITVTRSKDFLIYSSQSVQQSQLDLCNLFYFIPSAADGQQGYLQIFVISNYALQNSFVYRITGLYLCSLLTFQEKPACPPISTSIGSVAEFWFLPILTHFFILSDLIEMGREQLLRLLVILHIFLYLLAIWISSFLNYLF